MQINIFSRPLPEPISKSLVRIDLARVPTRWRCHCCNPYETFREYLQAFNTAYR
jgi:hypothetical protein